jgi:type I restriction enzyme S subunit
VSDWADYLIDDIADVFDGPHATPEKTERGPWFLSIASLNDGRLDISESAHISEDDFRRWTRRVTPQAGDVLFSYETRLGDAAIMPVGLRACLGRRMGLLRPRTELVDPRYLLYAYLGPEFQETIRRQAVHGATVDRIPLADVPKWRIRLPDLRSQKLIAEVLGALDEKFAVNEHTYITSHELLQACYVKMAEQPSGAVRLSDVIDLCYGKALKEVDRTPGPIPVFGGNGISGWHKRSLVDGPGIIVGRKGANAGSVSWSQQDFWAIDTAFYVRPTTANVTLEFLYFMLQTVGLTGQVGDSAIPGLNRSIALACTALLPDSAEIARFTELAKPILREADERERENRILAELRDTLLPKLVSGELRIKDAERAVEDAV